MKIYWAIILPIMIVILTAYTLLSLNVSRRIDTLQTALSQSTIHSISLHEDIGFGGLIHNFKNYLIRGDEIYLQRARQNAKEALRDVQRLEQDASSQGLALDLPLTREMITAYADRLETTETLWQQGLSPSDIDKVVSFDDRYALSEISKLLTAISHNIETESKSLQRLSVIQTVITAIACAFILFVAVALSQLTKHRQALKKANKQLHHTLELTEKANAALGQFAGVASHDLRAPIRHIRLFSDMIGEDIDNKEDVLAHTVNIKKSTARMNRLVQSLLSFAKTSNQVPAITLVNMNTLLDDVKEDLETQITEKSAILTIDTLPDVRADAELIARVFTNLIGNALKYSSPETPPQIHVAGLRDKTMTTFSVSDNGIGISPEYIDVVFEPLKRLHGPNSEYKGVGIGLALVKSVIESHGGEIWIDTEYRNGTKFNFTLPTS